MNHEQWEALKAATQGHTPGPWGNELFNNVFAKYDNRLLAATAPDLLTEVERLRGWIAFTGGNIKDEWLQRIIAAALAGAEVPK